MTSPPPWWVTGGAGTWFLVSSTLVSAMAVAVGIVFMLIGLGIRDVAEHAAESHTHMSIS